MAPLQSWARTWTPMGTLSEWFVGRCVRLHLLLFGYLVFVKLPSASWLVFGQYFGGIYPGQHRVLVSATAWSRRTCSCHGVLASRGLCTCSPHSSTIQAMQVSNRAAARVRVRMMYLHCNVWCLSGEQVRKQWDPANRMDPAEYHHDGHGHSGGACGRFGWGWRP